MAAIRNFYVIRQSSSLFVSASNDWWHALRWADVPESWQAKVGGEKVYWKTPEKKVGSCISCHANLEECLQSRSSSPELKRSSNVLDEGVEDSPSSRRNQSRREKAAHQGG